MDREEEIMKRKWIVLVILALSFTACGPMYEHRLLDGFWQMRHITYANGETEKAENIYYGFQLHLIHIRNLNSGSYFGEFDYTEDSLHVRILGASTQESLHPLGMNDTLQHFKVDVLTRNTLILQSDYARLEFRKY